MIRRTTFPTITVNHAPGRAPVGQRWRDVLARGAPLRRFLAILAGSVLLAAVACNKPYGGAPNPAPETVPLALAAGPPPPATPLAELQLVEGATVVFEGYLWSPGFPCPPCPEGVRCEPCPPPEDQFSEHPVSNFQPGRIVLVAIPEGRRVPVDSRTKVIVRGVVSDAKKEIIRLDAIWKAP